MTGFDFLENMNDLDEDLIEAASKTPKKVSNIWIKWVAAAASLVIISGLALSMSGMFSKKTDFNNNIVAFTFNGNQYENLGLNDYVSYGLLSTEDAELRTPVSVPELTKTDLGPKMGIVDLNMNGKIFPCSVHHFAKFPDDENICIIIFPNDEYKLYMIKEN